MNAQLFHDQKEQLGYMVNQLQNLVTSGNLSEALPLAQRIQEDTTVLALMEKSLEKKGDVYAY